MRVVRAADVVHAIAGASEENLFANLGKRIGEGGLPNDGIGLSIGPRRHDLIDGKRRHGSDDSKCENRRKDSHQTETRQPHGLNLPILGQPA